MRRRSWVIIGAIVLVTVAAFVVVYFQPQKLLYDQRVDEALPTAGPTTGPSRGEVTPTASEPVELASGTFISREHETTGTARVVRLSDGRVILRFENFQTSNGPLLVVWLSQNAADGDDASFDDRYFALGALKGNVGDQNYVVPPEIDATGWTSVVVWCDRFNVSFGAADLTPSAAA